jgi:hypothetical protein
VIKNDYFNYDIRKKRKKVLVVVMKELPHHVVTAAAILGTPGAAVSIVLAALVTAGVVDNWSFAAL